MAADLAAPGRRRPASAPRRGVCACLDPGPTRDAARSGRRGIAEIMDYSLSGLRACERSQPRRQRRWTAGQDQRGGRV